MALQHEADPPDTNEYDEDADSDFDVNASDDEAISASSADEDDDLETTQKQSGSGKKQAKQSPDAMIVEPDSGDEATVKEQEKARGKRRRKDQNANDTDSGRESEGWKAKTRAMRQQEQIEKKKNKLATSKVSTIDVDRIWEEMNKPGPLPPLRMEGAAASNTHNGSSEDPVPQDQPHGAALVGDTITIKRQFKFAGEVHVEEKVVPKDSAEARLWLAQQERKPQQEISVDGEQKVNRPLRKISRFDPNYNNLAAYKTNWTRNNATSGADQFSGPKLNVVEKSKMDWASHVDAEGLKDELDTHAKAKEGYHNRMDFLRHVEHRKEEEARIARLSQRGPV